MYEQRQAGAVVRVVIHVTVTCLTARMTNATLPSRADISAHLIIQDAAMMVMAWATMADYGSWPSS